MNIKNSSFSLFIISLFLLFNLPINKAIRANAQKIGETIDDANQVLEEGKKVGETINQMNEMMNPDNKVDEVLDEPNEPDEKMNHDEMMNHGNKMGQENHQHEHKPLDISELTNIPTLKINAYPDTIKGWNLEIKTTNFDFTPENLNKSSNPNQGHAHLYVNGEKVGRIYSNWYYIPELPEGENQVKVTLNTDNHETLVYKGKQIRDLIVIDNQ